MIAFFACGRRCSHLDFAGYVVARSCERPTSDEELKQSMASEDWRNRLQALVYDAQCANGGPGGTAESRASWTQGRIANDDGWRRSEHGRCLCCFRAGASDGVLPSWRCLDAPLEWTRELQSGYTYEAAIWLLCHGQEVWAPWISTLVP